MVRGRVIPGLGKHEPRRPGHFLVGVGTGQTRQEKQVQGKKSREKPHEQNWGILQTYAAGP
jgi:hypothetical protein